METTRIATRLIKHNNGQINGVPRNPRQWTKEDVTRLAKSIAETPELLEMRPCIIYPHKDRFVVIGGNMRLSACAELGWADVPCIIMPEDTTPAKLKEIAAKDNGTFGKWDFDELANAWDDLPLTEWGIPAWDTPAQETPTVEDPSDDEAGEQGEKTTKDTSPRVVVFSVSLFGQTYDKILHRELSQEVSDRIMADVKATGAEAVLDKMLGGFNV